MLEGHLRLYLDVPAAPMSVRQFAAGSANLTYLLTFGEVHVVLRRPPRGALAPGAHDMAREFRVLSLLGDVYGRAPRALYFSADTAIIGAPFVVAEYRTGLVIGESVPASMAHYPDIERRIDLALIDAAADLHAVDVDATGLGKIGRPAGFGQRQVEGWRDRWRRAAPVEGSELMDQVGDRLAKTLPLPARAAGVHNDLKLDNCQFQVTDPDTVSTVFDWDMATLGNPLFDLGLMLVSMSSSPVWVLSNDEAIARYSERSGIDVTCMDWYMAFATWRTAVVLQQLYNRYLAGDSADERFARFGAAIPAYAERASELIA